MIKIKPVRPRKPPAPSEAALHKAAAEYLSWVLKPPVQWTTIGHGGGGRVRGAQLKAMGLRPGWPDILILAPGPLVLGIELKRKGGVQTAEQRAMEAAFTQAGARYVVCRSLDAVEAAINAIAFRARAA